MNISHTTCVRFIFLTVIRILLLILSTTTVTYTQALQEVTAAHGPTIARSLRLPNTTYPLRYHLHFTTNIHREIFDYSANVTIDVLIKESTNELVLHAKKFTDYAITVTEIATNSILEDIVFTYDPVSSFLIIHPVENYQAFEAGQEFRVEILFNAVMQANTIGIYWLTYKDGNNKTVYLTATQFEPTSARYAFPCYDEPAFKSNFTISITHGSNYSAISNMLVKEKLLHSDTNMTTTIFHETPPVSTYLVAFVVSNFEYISREYRGVMQRIFTPPNSPYKGEKALRNAVRTVAAFEDYLGIKYSLSKLDHIALEKNYGAAMENWGLITYRDTALLHDSKVDVGRNLKDLITQNHEIAHQWFGNLVSPVWWMYAWLNEGFATYFGYLITDMLYPEYKVMDFFLTDVAERAYGSYITVRPMTHYVEKESDISSIFDYISYQRAACVIKMFHHAFNQRIFLRGINRYLKKFQFSVATEGQLFDTLQESIVESNRAWNLSVYNIMITWTHSEYIPLVSVIFNREQLTLTIRQKSKEGNSKELWWIPLSFATVAQPDFENTVADYFMPPVSEVTIPLAELGLEMQPNDWFIVNKQQTGFYHVLYDYHNLLAIAGQLHGNHTVIHPLNRAAIFQDLSPLIENNEMSSVEVIFELLKYLHHEQELIPWNSVADVVNFFEKNLYGTASHPLYKRFIRRLVAPMFYRLFHTSSTEQKLTVTEVQTRQKVMEMACNADLPECLELTRLLAHEIIIREAGFDEDKNYFGMQQSILCLGVKYLSDEEFNAVLEMLSKIDRDTNWYNDLIWALACTQSSVHLRQFLNVLMGENSTHIILNDNESMMYLFYLYRSNIAARPAIWRFFDKNYKILCKSPLFVEHMNRIAEYSLKRYRGDFLTLRQLIEDELNSLGKGNRLIAANSKRIGSKVKMSEIFLEKFEPLIYEWLRSETDTVEQAASIGARSSAYRIGNTFRYAGRLFNKILQIKF